MDRLDILLPTCNRLDSLVMTLSGVAAQDVRSFRLIVADQSQEPANTNPVVQSLLRIIEARGGEVVWHTRPAVWGIAEQRDFLLRQASAASVLYLDDDVFMEPWVAGRMRDILETRGCGFVGAFPAGLSFRDDVRPEQQAIEYWDGPVKPETLEPGTPAWERWHLHRAANLWQVARALPGGDTRLYKVAWVASCVMYNRRKLLDVGGFSFWSRLPRYHSGEEVLVQNLLLRRWGGCGMIPSGTYYSQLPSTVLNGEGGVDGHALDLLGEMAMRYAPESLQEGFARG